LVQISLQVVVPFQVTSSSTQACRMAAPISDMLTSANVTRGQATGDNGASTIVFSQTTSCKKPDGFYKFSGLVYGGFFPLRGGVQPGPIQRSAWLATVEVGRNGSGSGVSGDSRSRHLPRVYLSFPFRLPAGSTQPPTTMLSFQAARRFYPILVCPTSSVDDIYFYSFDIFISFIDPCSFCMVKASCRMGART